MNTQTQIESKVQNGNGRLPAKPLPNYTDLVSMADEKAKENDLQVLLNQEPPAAWVKTNELANRSKYIPIDKVEYLLTRLFVKWWAEVIDYKVIANSIAVHVRLFYTSPITGQTLHQDGLGAAPMQTNKGANATDFTQIKNSAVQMSLPAAETYAIKDAAEKIGRIFGKDLNRKDLMAYENLAGRFNQVDPAIKDGMAMCTDKINLDQYRTQLEKQNLFTPEVETMFNNYSKNLK